MAPGIFPTGKIGPCVRGETGIVAFGVIVGGIIAGMLNPKWDRPGDGIDCLLFDMMITITFFTAFFLCQKVFLKKKYKVAQERCGDVNC